jgi:phytoene dehydrogenase-like protein
VKRAVVIGSGPNGLAGAVALARAGIDVEVHEAASTVGGGARTEELTLPGFRHDTCSAIHPLGAASPFFRALGLSIDWVHSPAAAAHPFDDGTAVSLERDVDATAGQLGADGPAYRRLVRPLVEAWAAIEPVLVGPYPPPPRALADLARALGVARLGRALRAALADARSLADAHLTTPAARGFLAGHAAHSVLPLERRPSAGVGLTLVVMGHALGWGFPRGGAGRIADALVAELARLGGRVHTGSPVDELPEAEVVLCDVAPRELLRIAGPRVPERYARALRRFRHGSGAFKLDWALGAPIPWRAEECRRAATIHLGGSFDEIALSEWNAWSGRSSERPCVLLAQHSLWDDTRAPPGSHTAWAYCHVANGSSTDMTEAIERQVERFAPGFRDVILTRSAMGPAALEAHNRNLVGGDVNGGAMDLGQLFFRPVRRLIPYRTPLRGVYLCSASTPPGGGVHGMCGYGAALVALRDLGLPKSLVH